MNCQAIGVNSRTLLKILFIFLCLSLSIACDGVGRVVRSSVSPDEIKEMGYFSPIYSTQIPEFANSKRHFHFVRSTTKILDSIFEMDAEKYGISGKISEENTGKMHRVYAGITLVFREIDSNRRIQDIKIPATIRSVLRKQHSRFAFALKISPDFITFNQRFPGKILTGPEILNSYFVKSSVIQVLIFDLENNNIAFYRKLPGVKYLENRKKHLDDSLTEIFNSYFF